MVQKCSSCNKKTGIHAKGKCFPCYKKDYKSPLINCIKCEKKKRHHAFGLCTSCYIREHKPHINKSYITRKKHNLSLDKWREITRECAVCGFDKIVRLHTKDNKNFVGLCPNHYEMLKDGRHRKEVEALMKEVSEEKRDDYLGHMYS